MRLVGGLAVEADRALTNQPDAIAARPHEPGAPQPLVQTLPVAVFLFGDDCPLPTKRRKRSEWSVNGSCRFRFRDGALSARCQNHRGGRGTVLIGSQTGGGQNAKSEAAQDHRQLLWFDREA